MIDFKNKTVAVLGLGASGLAACELLIGKKAKVKASEIKDSKEVRNKIKKIGDRGIEFEAGKHSEKFILSSDIIVVSPGVRHDLPFLEKAREKEIPIISEIELAYQFCPSKIIAVTGTNGKTTTVKLISHLLRGKFNIFEGGNLDIPHETSFSSFVSKLSKKDIVVLETSSFQLQNILYFKPYISLILNITPDHLNMHKNMDDYINAKTKIFSNQKKDDFAVVNEDDLLLSKIRQKIHPKIFRFSLNNTVSNGTYLSGENILFSKNGQEEIVCDKKFFPLKGEHNMQNCVASITAAKILGLDNKHIQEGLKTFQNLEHRMEEVGEIRGVEFINDSKSTNVACVEKALSVLNPPIILILGGKDKGNDYSLVKQLVKEKVKNIFAFGESSEKIAGFFKDTAKVIITSTLEETIESAFKSAEPKDKILFSPSCASFDMFKDYKDRGNRFKSFFLKLKGAYE